jgi:peptide/nickel transport system substrate-binding protein
MALNLGRPERRAPGWPLLVVLALGVAGLVIVLYAFTDPLGGDEEDRTVYREALVGVPSRINPLFVHMNDVDRDISSLVFSGLTRLGPDGTPAGDLAESWEVSDDGRIVTFSLRSGVTWHNGQPLTSEDVVFTYGFLADPNLQSDPEQATLWQSLSCVAPDDLTVECTLPEPYSPFLAYATVGILPRHILQSATPQSVLDDPFNRAPVGSGPYKLVSLSDGEAVLHAHESFHLGGPRIDEMRLRFYPDVSAAAASLLLGETEGLLADLTIEPEDLQALVELDGLAEHVANRGAYTSLYLNNTAPVLNDISVRRAIELAVDVDAIVSGLMNGRAVRTATPIVPGTWAFGDGVEASSQDIGEARAILDEAGWLLPEGQQVREREGTQLRLTIATDDDPLRGAIAEMIGQQLSNIGIGASVVAQSPDELVREFLIPRLYQAAVFGWDPGVDPDPYPAWHSSQALEGGRNLAGYSSEPADELMEEGRREYDYGERAELYGRFQGQFLEDIPSVTLFSPLYTYFVADDVEEVAPGALFTTASRFQNVHQWRIAESSVIGG